MRKNIETERGREREKEGERGRRGRNREREGERKREGERRRQRERRGREREREREREGERGKEGEKREKAGEREREGEKGREGLERQRWGDQEGEWHDRTACPMPIATPRPAPNLGPGFPTNVLLGNVDWSDAADSVGGPLNPQICPGPGVIRRLLRSQFVVVVRTHISSFVIICH